MKEMIAVKKKDQEKEYWVTVCQVCNKELSYNVLEKNKNIKLICPKCGSSTTMKHMSNGEIRRMWETKNI